MERTMKALMKPVSLLYPQVETSTFTSSTADLQYFGAAMFLLMVGTFTFTTSNKITPSLQESDDGTTFTAVAAADYLDGIPAALVGTVDQQTIRQFNYRGAKRYVQLVGTIAGTVSVSCAIAVMEGYPDLRPPL